MGSDADKLRLVLPNFRWIVEQKLAGMSRPSAADAFALLHTLGISAIISLTEEPLPRHLLNHWGMQAIHLPIRDYTAPTVTQIIGAVTAVEGFIAEGKAVAIHCYAGLGRTGTIGACYLVSQGLSSAQAIAIVRAQQPGAIETPEQEQSVTLYERRLRRM